MKGHSEAKDGDLSMNKNQLIDAMERANDGVIVKTKVYREGTRKFTMLIPSEEGLMVMSEVYGKKNGTLQIRNAWRSPIKN